jgi:L-malate glycosyltransferase
MSDVPIRVCHIMTADLWAGAEVQVATAAGYLVERPDVKLTAVLFNEGWLARELRRLRVEVAVVDERRHTAFEILTFLVRFLRERAVDVVHTHRSRDTILGTVAAKLAGIPCAVRTVHGMSELPRGWDRAKVAACSALDKAVLRCFADRIVAVSVNLAERLERSWVWPSAVTAIHSGIDLRAIRARRSLQEVRRTLGIGLNELVIGTAGRLVPVKGHVYLIRAARLILEKEPRARFLFVGSGPLQNELSVETAVLGVSHACIFIDPRIDVWAGVCDLVAAMDVFVLPSIDEGLPVALLEAMALGRPAVATAVGGVPEIVTHRTTGLLVEPRDPRGIAAACLALTVDPHWTRSLASSGREIVRTRFSQQQNAEALIDVYRQVVRGRSRAIRRPSVPRACSPARTGIPSYVAGKLEYLSERRRMMRIRRRPAALNAMLRSATTILIVCHGNIIRSPFAARLIKQMLSDRAPIAIRSAGVEADPGRRPDPAVVLAASRLGIDLRDHAASPITLDTVANADVIFVMEIAQLVVMRPRFPQACARTFLLATLCPDGPLEIPDPLGGDAAAFQKCFAHIARAASAVVQVVGVAP